MATLTLYNYSGPFDTINKTLTGGTVKTGTQVDTPQSFTDMQIIIESATAPTWNYCTMSDTGRNYFITNIEWLGGKAFMLTLHVDVLTSNKTAIDALYAQVEYSTKGDALEHDPRLNLKDYISEYTSGVKDYYNVYDDDTSGREPMVLIRYRYMPSRLDAHTPHTQISTVYAALMSNVQFSNFIADYVTNNHTDAEREAVGNAIIDISQVYYITEARCAASSLTQAQQITFVTPDKPDGVAISTADYGAYKFYICDNPVSQLSTLGYYEAPAFSVPAAYYPYVNAHYVSHLPFIGDKDVVPSEWDISYVCDVKYRITLDLIGNNYVLTPIVTKNNVDTFRYDHVDVIANKKRQGFAVNSALDRSMWGDVGLIASGVMAAWTGNFAGVIQAGREREIIQTEVAGATQYKGGISSEYEYAMELYPKFRNVMRAVEYDTNPTVFWPKWGYPDHQIRLLSSLTDGDYFKCEKVEMRGFSTITKSEVDEIEQKLLSGVYA